MPTDIFPPELSVICCHELWHWLPEPALAPAFICGSESLTADGTDCAHHDRPPSALLVLRCKFASHQHWPSTCTSPKVTGETVNMLPRQAASRAPVLCSSY